MFLQDYSSMHITVVLVIINAQNVLAVRVFTFPALAGSPYFFDKFSFNESLTYGTNEVSERKLMRELNP
jgi:hypothetical protein